ncbi:helix-turn-helix protein [Paenibacillus taihuensis]|uniref:Helix-turn-helix protein n=1 Tax=Paenibacillus taihuensis TaxID=1156355 RepID=A0A3D9S3J1_9BACL|nr:helix-turn-helix domain-containing protein [Paenibacillus taihuensis]REE87365.1 helix-turn-helix protein [Paenibacillus taihuensis]
MGKTERLRRASNSLFLQLLLSFLAILVPLISFFFFSFTLLNNHATDEVIKYNTLSMNKTIDKYENHFNHIRNIGLDLLLDEKLETLNRPTVDYLNARALMRTINGYLSHKEIAVQNILIYLKKSNFVISGDRGVRADELFSKYYKSDSYPPSFWTKQFTGSGSLSILPASDFKEKAGSVMSAKGRFIPVVVRNNFFPDYQVIVMLDENLMLQEFHDSPDEPFLMFAASGLQLAADNVSDKELQSVPRTTSTSHTSFVKKDGIYYFHKTGSITGIRYMRIVPDNLISAQISQVNTILLTLLILFAAVSVCAAWFFTKRFHNPVKSIMRSIQQLNAPSPRSESSIHEFKYIHDQVRQLVETSNTTHHADARKNSLLRYYAFLNKIKNINVKDQEYYDFNVQEPYRLLLFQLQFTPRFSREIDADEGKASLFVREYLDTHLKEHVETQTIQLEQDLILSLVIGGQVQEEPPAFLTSLKAVFDLDQRYWSMTIGVGNLYRSSADLTRAYEQVQSIMEYRKLGGAAQILTSADAPPDYQAVMSGLQEQELQANLSAGNEDAVLRLIAKVLGVMDKKGATANQFYDFAESIVQLSAKTASSMQLDLLGYKGYLTSLGKLRCSCTMQELQSYLTSLLTYVIGRIHEKKAEKDNIITFVKSYTEQHYQHDITLDILSDKLGISASYLSTYFKTKTGMNFIDYINNYRIELAKSLLKADDMRIQDVALQVGYQNINSFNRMFKKISGVTPSEFRKQQYLIEG